MLKELHLTWESFYLPQRFNLKGLILIFLATLCWAIDTLIRYPLLNHYSAVEIVFAEHLILSAIFLPIFIKSLKALKNLTPVQIFYLIFLGGVGGALCTLAFTYAFYLVGPSVAVLIQKLQPLVVILLAHFILQEKLKWNFALWGFIAVCGSLMVSFPNLFTDSWSDAFAHVQVFGLIFLLFSVVGWATSLVFAKNLGQKLKPIELMSYRFIIATFFLLFLYLFSSAPNHFIFTFNLSNLQNFWAMVTALAFLSGVFGMWFYYRGLAILPAKLATLSELFFPFLTVILNWRILGVPLNFWQILGGSLILLAVTMVQFRRY